MDNARALLNQLFFDPKRYDLTRVGRYKLNSRLGLDIDLDVRTLTHDDILALVRELVRLPNILGISEELDEDLKDYAAEALSRPREAVEEHLDEYEHFGNRRLRTVGELIQEAFRIGLYRMERVVRERLTTEDADTITPQTIINIRPVVAALKEFFGSSQLSQFMDQTNSLSGLTHRRRLNSLGAGGLTRERAPIEVRDVHPTHYGRMCPIETPEGPNIGLIGSLSRYAQVSEYGFVTTPYRVVKDGKLTEEIVRLDATEEQERLIAQANEPLDENGKLLGDSILCRTQAGQYVYVEPTEVDLIDVSPEQIWSVATAMIPFLEHDDANRALMGSNMQRQAVPLLKTDAPLIGTGMERRAALDTGDVLLARNAGTVDFVDATRIVVNTEDGGRDEYDLQKFMRSNQGTLIHQKPFIKAGQAGQGRASCWPTARRSDKGEMALGKNLMRRLHVLGGLQLRGRDHPLAPPGQGRRADLDPHRGVRGRRPHDQARRRGDHARHPEPLGGVAAQPRRSRDRAHRRRGAVGRSAGGQGHAEGRDRADGRGEADPRDLQGEGARGPRHVA